MSRQLMQDLRFVNNVNNSIFCNCYILYTDFYIYLTIPKFRVALIFGLKRCAKIAPTIFAQEACAKIKRRDIRFLGVREN